MIVATVRISGAEAYVVDKKKITSGMVGAKVRLEYIDPIWDGLDKLVVFCGSGVIIDHMTNDTIVTIPAEVVAKPKNNLYIGVQGVDTNRIVVLPTVSADLGYIHIGTTPSGNTNTDITLPPWAQVKAMIGNLEDLDTDAKESLVAAVNEALTKGGGSVDDADIQRIVAEYLAANPPSGGLDITDDGDGNVVIAASGGVTVTDDGAGNITIA